MPGKSRQEMTMTIVACHNTNPAGQRVHYTNRRGHPIDGTKTFVTSIPAASGLSGLAQFLAEHIYNTSNHRGALMVRCYDDRRTEGDLLRATGRANAETIIRAYDLDAKPAVINDWLFPVLDNGEAPGSFWMRAAEQMVRAGVTRVAVDTPMAARAEYRIGG
jgi:hypothetical protein